MTTTTRMEGIEMKSQDRLLMLVPTFVYAPIALMMILTLVTVAGAA